MSSICNKSPITPPPTGYSDSVLDQVDAPVATGSAHLMRFGAELHLLHADLELGDIRLAAIRVASARAALDAAAEQYTESHRLAIELDFYQAHDERLRARHGGSFGVAEVLTQAQDSGLIHIDGKAVEALERTYADGGDQAAFGSFIADVTSLSATLAAFDSGAADAEPVLWQRFAWAAVTEFDRLRIRGQAMAIINTYTEARSAV